MNILSTISCSVQIENLQGTNKLYHNFFFYHEVMFYNIWKCQNLIYIQVNSVKLIDVSNNTFLVEHYSKNHLLIIRIYAMYLRMHTHMHTWIQTCMHTCPRPQMHYALTNILKVHCVIYIYIYICMRNTCMHIIYIRKHSMGRALLSHRNCSTELITNTKD